MSRRRRPADHRAGGRPAEAGLSRTSASPRSATSRTGACWLPAARPAATASTAAPTSAVCAPSLPYSAISICRSRSSGSAWRPHPRFWASSSPASARLGASPSLKREDAVYTQEEICENAGIDAAFLRLLVEYRLIDRRGQQGPAFTESDLEIARICQLLVRFGVEPRNLRLLGSSVEREAASSSRSPRRRCARRMPTSVSTARRWWKIWDRCCPS